MYTIKTRKWWSFNFKSSQTIFLTHSLQIVEDDFSKQKFCNRLTFVLIVSFLICIRFVAFVSSNDLCRLQNDQVFCQMISKRSCLFRSNFLNFVSRLKFLFRAQFVHAKVTLDSDRKYYKRKRDDDDRERSCWSMRIMINLSLTKRKNALFLLLLDLMTRLLRIFSCSLWSSFLVCLAEVTVRFVSESCLKWEISCTLENALSLTINRSSSVSLSKDRRRCRLLEFRWDAWTVAALSSQKDIWILWSSIRRCLKALLNSFHAYLFTFSLETRRTSSTSAVYDVSFVFEFRTSI
jgi:hypothetical protein